jgi:hypothetical protein
MIHVTMRKGASARRTRSVLKVGRIESDRIGQIYMGRWVLTDGSRWINGFARIYFRG